MWCRRLPRSRTLARHFADLLGADNVEPVRASFDALELPDASVVVMAFASIHGAGRDKIEALARRAAAFMRPEGLVLGACVQVVRPGEADAMEILSAFQGAGFEVRAQQVCSYALEVGGRRGAQMLELGAEELLTPDSGRRPIDQVCMFVALGRASAAT